MNNSDFIFNFLVLNVKAIEIADSAAAAKPVNNLLQSIIATVTAIGASVFTLAVLIIAIAIIFGSISPKNIGVWWKAFFSCLAGAVLFFGVNLLSESISALF